jgi:hypothetical protein
MPSVLRQLVGAKYSCKSSKLSIALRVNCHEWVSRAESDSLSREAADKMKLSGDWKKRVFPRVERASRRLCV